MAAGRTIDEPDVNFKFIIACSCQAMIQDFAGDVGWISSIIIAEVKINYSKWQSSIVIYLFHMALSDAVHTISISQLCLLIR